MNKKFFTLLAAALFSVGAMAQNAAWINPTTGTSSATYTPTVVPPVTSGNPNGGYQKDRSYFLGDGTGFLFVENGTLKMGASPSFSSFELVNQALWTLMEITEGTTNPQYTFINNSTSTVLAMNKDAAVAWNNAAPDATAVTNAPSAMGGDVATWHHAPSYTTPVSSPFYAPLTGDSSVVLVKKAATGLTDVYLSKMLNSELTTSGDGRIVKLVPYQLPTTALGTLSPRQLNTLLYIAGNEATKDSYFSLNFTPSATMNGEANGFTADLQAMAVEQYELMHGVAETTAGSSSQDNLAKSAFSSFYAKSAISTILPGTPTQAYVDGKSYKNIRDAAVNGFNDNTPQWVALKNRDGKYLVVDTVHVRGTGQSENPRITFAWDDLYNAKKDSRFRDPRSYLFRFDYNPNTKTLEILSMAYTAFPATTASVGAPLAAGSARGFDAATFYAGQFTAQPIKEGSKWFADGEVGGSGTTKNDQVYTNANDRNFVVFAALSTVTEITLGAKTTTPNNQFVIKLGNSDRYQLTYKRSGAYLLQITGSSNKANIGKFYIDNLKGGFEIMERAKRQDFQHMPAAQWIVKSAGSSAGSPVTIQNREFENLIAQGSLYGVAGSTTQAFFMGGDTLDFIPVATPNDKYLGYMNVNKNELDETVYTFNYLHDLIMDKPINTVNDVDSVVWVDKDGNDIKFRLEIEVEEDAYGSNNAVSGVANLVRNVYLVRVKDATKLQNDGRYLAYDANLKKYIVAKDKARATRFFIKENNHSDENLGHYYALVLANVENVASATQNAGTGFWTTNAGDNKMVVDSDIAGKFIGIKAAWTNPETGLPEDKWQVRTFTGGTALADANAYIAANYPGYSAGLEAIQFTNATTYAIRFVTADYAGFNYITGLNSYYADYKVSVDNNTLDLVNGLLNNESWREVATSAFSVTPSDDPLYRRFNDAELEENADDSPNTLKFFRSNSIVGDVKEYLYEDASSVYSTGKGINFLGVEAKGISKNAAMWVDTAYVQRNTKMPQYLIALRPSVTEGTIELCPECGDITCEHSKVTRRYVDAHYLINFQDSIDVNEGAAKTKFQFNNQYTRLGFVPARHIGDSLIIKNSVYTGNNTPIVVGKPATYASRDTINLGNNQHKNVVFSMRLINSDAKKDFLMESETQDKDGNYAKNKPGNLVKIAPTKGGWIKIQNGVPVIANMSYNEAGLDAEIFNVEVTDEDAVANDNVEVTTVSVAGDYGQVIIQGAAGKTVVISNVLGQTVASQTINDNNVTIQAPAGVVVVAVQGEKAVKALVK